MELFNLLGVALLALLVRKLAWCLRWLWCYYHGRETPDPIPFLPRRSGAVFSGHVASRMEVPALSTLPDGPVPFGYKTAWLALRCGGPEPVLAALGAGEAQRANWATGLAAALEGPGGWVFVSPALEGLVLAVGPALFALAEREDALEALAARFPEVQYFASHRTSDAYCWARYEAGRCLRAYYTGDGAVLRDTGALTPEERALGFAAFSPLEGAGEGRLPGEEDVLDLAAAWGVDPRFQRPYPPGAGWLCRVEL